MSSIAIRIRATGEKSCTGAAHKRIATRLLASTSEFVTSGIATIRIALKPAGGLLLALTGVSSISLSQRMLEATDASKRGNARTAFSLRSLISSGVLVFVQGVARISMPLRSLLDAGPAKSGEAKISQSFLLVEAATKAIDAIVSSKLPIRSFITNVIGTLASGVVTLRLILRSQPTAAKASTGAARTAAAARVRAEAAKASSGETKASIGLSSRVRQVVGFFVAGTARISIALRAQTDGEKSQSAVNRIGVAIRLRAERSLVIRTIRKSRRAVVDAAQRVFKVSRSNRTFRGDD